MEIMKLQDNAEITKAHFTAPFSYFVIESVIEGNTYGETFVDKLDNPHITIVWDTKYSINCGGCADKEVLKQAVEFIKSDILTYDVRQDRGIIKIMYENKEWEQAILEGVQGFNYEVYPRSVYRHELDHIPNFQCKDEGITIKKLDEELVNNNKLKNHEGLIEELTQMWGSVESFLSKGFGYCAITKDSIAAWCTGEYFSKAWCGIGIETYEEYQRQGIAAAATVEIIKHCKERNKTPHWDCWKNNIPSVKTAEKTGFQKLMDYEVVFLKFF